MNRYAAWKETAAEAGGTMVLVAALLAVLAAACEGEPAAAPAAEAVDSEQLEPNSARGGVLPPEAKKPVTTPGGKSHPAARRTDTGSSKRTLGTKYKNAPNRDRRHRVGRSMPERGQAGYSEPKPDP